MNNLESFGIPSFKKGSGIHIKKKNRGKFTEYCDGKVTQKCIDKAKKSGNKTLVKRATFAENARKWKHLKGGSLYSAGNVVNTLYENNDVHEKLGTPWHKYDFTLSEEWANAHGYFPDERGHRDDRVKKETHPSHPSRGRWNKPGTKFYLSEKGMQDPNHTLFGLADGGLDPLATLYYKNGIVLPEITVTPTENYIHNSYDNIKLSSRAQKHQWGGKTKFHQNWLNLRIPILAKNAKISEEEALKLANKLIQDLKNTPEYMYDSPLYYRELSIQDLYDAEYAFDSGAHALYDTEGKFIVYLDPYLKDFAKTHERTHAMNPVELELAITKYKNEKRKIFSNPKLKYDRYLDSSTEVYARLMDAREKYKLDPKKSYTKDDIQQIRELIKKDWGIDETHIFNRYDDDYILHLLNDIAQNDPIKEADGISYAQSGGQIKKLDIASLKADPEYKNNYNWYIHDANINALQDSLINRNAGYALRIAALSMVIPESGGKPDPHGNGAVGLIGWRGDRAKDLPADFGGQAHELMNGLFSNDEALHWSHGGVGTGVNTGKEMYLLYNTSQNVNQATSAIMKGYVRPEKSEYQKRLEFAQLLKRHMK